MIVNAYGKSREERESFWELLKKGMEKFSGRMIAIGDLNARVKVNARDGVTSAYGVLGVN